MDGVERIAAERKRQIEELGYTPEHDDHHANMALAYAAACYAAPEPIYHLNVQEGLASDGVSQGNLTWHEPWPFGWERSPRTPDVATRMRELEKAGALIAAEIDRLQMLLDDVQGGA